MYPFLGTMATLGVFFFSIFFIHLPHIANVDISVSQQLHWDVTAPTVGLMLARWWLGGATRVVGGKRGESSWGKEGDAATLAAAGGQRDESW